MINETNEPLTYPFALTPLPFAYDALEPYIDAATMKIHHNKHHQAYITSLNAAIKPHPELHDSTVEELVRRCAAGKRACQQGTARTGNSRVQPLRLLALTERILSSAQ
jgi:superoxide dismutase